MIDYSIISDSLRFYEIHGFTRVEVPWTVTKAISDITRPSEAKDFQLIHEDHKVLVASAEQSFLYQYAKGFLPKGRFQAVTPCFRHDSFDALHTKYFIKNELIDTEKVTTERLLEMVDIAKKFLSEYFPEKDLKITSDGMTGDAFDIEYLGVELGSYGIRSCGYLEWIYGTGVAEPRISSRIKSIALAKSENDRIKSY